MSFSINTHNFPSIERHADARAHWDKVKPYRHSCESDERPIGSRRGQLNDTKTMRVLSDGSIAFKYHRTDCVVWHPDDSVTIKGWSSVSTTSFINALAPCGVSHGQGSGWSGDPILYLHPMVRNNDWRDYYSSALIVRCSSPVRLAKTKERWMPVELDTVSPFSVPTIDRKAARAASAKYHLAVFDGVVRAILALGGGLVPRIASMSDHQALSNILPLLEQEDYVEATSYCPRGGGSLAFGRKEGDPSKITPGFMRKIRDAVYEQEMVVDRTDQRVLTYGQYRRYLEMVRRF